MSDFEKRVKDELHKRTAEESHGLQDEIWNELEQELFNEDRGDVQKLKKKGRIISVIGLIAAGLLIAFSLQTDTGSAFIQSVKDMFVPEKEITQGIEGQDEETEVHLKEGIDSKYIIYIDETRYKMVKGENSDVITTIDPLPEDFPEVKMEITQLSDEKPEDLVEKIEAELKVDFPELREIEHVTEPVEGYLLHGINGSEWDSNVVHLYVISNGNEGSYVIREDYFLEAAEGHGARFHYMLESFEIVEEN
ncbi:hypothetical protein [Sporosarcina sp. 6E9]|uniref:hypothetical protein n=1 Tax=Sporosarcina sp. 6E9 TaxID=2819235 RepID=UPI001B31515E|nr:hypothetical protein [Sporosarcina sp. 6E9]